jgi:hypothetical protein
VWISDVRLKNYHNLMAFLMPHKDAVLMLCYTKHFISTFRPERLFGVLHLQPTNNQVDFYRLQSPWLLNEVV